MGMLAIGVAFAICGAVAQAQQQARVPKIGILEFRPPASSSGHESLGREHRALDNADGKNKVFETRSAEDKVDRLHALADELVGLNVDVLLAPSTPEALAFKKVTKTIPIVFMVSTDPVADGLVESLARPGGNITGVTTITPVLAGKRLELLKETIPKLTRVAVLWNPQDPSSAQTWKESRFAGRELGLELHSMEVSSIDKLEGAFKEAVKARSAALAVTSSPFINSNEKRITDLAAKYRLPAIFDRGEFVAIGGLMSYAPDPAESYRRVAAIVDKILKGAKPADIPVEQPTKFELQINLKTARNLGLTIPPVVLMRAQKVIK
ncbi:MAG: ABC transporter substrate-binding protein [Deltaproteobacteria bacterium]|nr:ABC transporter substrate-binding protein [Deltaproteobacteria bacterium]